MQLTGVEPTYQVLSIVGLNPPRAQVNTTTIVGMDGAVFNSSKLATRNIVLTVKINGEVEQNRLLLYRYFPTKEPCKLYYSNDTLNVMIEGYVESVECNYFSNAEQAQISIICPSPYFRAIDEMINDISAIMAMFEFPFFINEGEPIPFSEYIAGRESAVMNNSESECGCEIDIEVSPDIDGAITTLLITNETTGDWLALDGTKTADGGFIGGQKITINTNKGKKSIMLWDDGVTVSAFQTLKSGSTFIQMKTGENVMSYAADGGMHDGDVTVIVRHYDVYRGV